MARRKAKSARIAFDGDVTLRGIEAAHTQLRDAIGQMAPAASLELDCTGVEAADLAFIQLLLATRKSAAQRGGTVTLAFAATGGLHDALMRGGFLAEAASDRAFWLPEPSDLKEQLRDEDSLERR